MMKELKGKWIIEEMKAFDEKTETMVWKTVKDLKATESDPDILQMLSTVLHFKDDGMIDMLIPVPEGVSKEEIDEAVAAGEIEMVDGLMLMEQMPWKVEDGKAYYDSGEEGEFVGEAISPWHEILETANGIELMAYRLIPKP